MGKLDFRALGALFLVALWLLSACSGQRGAAGAQSNVAIGEPQGHTLGPPSPSASLPSIEALDALRRPAGLKETIILGRNALMSSPGALINGTAMTLNSHVVSENQGADQWALYCFVPSVLTLDSLAVLLDAPPGEGAWIGLANYSKAGWEWSGPFGDAKTLSIDGGDYLSANGKFYCVIYTSKGNAADISALSIRTLTLGNQPPVAVLNADLRSGGAPLTVHFDASASSDSDGTIIEYAWDWDGDGLYDGLGESPTATHTFTQPGQHSVRLRVSDDAMARSSAMLSVNATVPGNYSPTANFTANPAVGDAPLQVSFDADASTAGGDPGDSILKYEWDWNADGVYDDTHAGSVAFHTFAGGRLDVQLRVTDSAGNQDTIQKAVTARTPPVANLVLTPSELQSGETVLMDGSGSTDVDGSIVRYEWDADGDGDFEESTGGSPSYSFHAGGGTKQLSLRVTDDSGATDTDTKTLTGHGWSLPRNISNWSASQTFSLGVIRDKPAVAYCPGLDMFFRKATDPQSDSWTTETSLCGLESNYPALFGSAGNPAICYFNDYDNTLCFRRSLDVDGDVWDTEQALAPAQLGGLGIYPSALSASWAGGRPAICYENWAGAPGASAICLWFIVAEDIYGTSWSAPVKVNDVGCAPVLISAAGRPAVCYIDPIQHDLLYSRADDALGVTWGASLTIDPNVYDYRDASLSMVTGYQIYPTISYLDSQEIVRVVQASDNAGVSWGAPQVISSSWTDFQDMVILGTKLLVAYTQLGKVYTRESTNSLGTSWGAEERIWRDANGYIGGEKPKLQVINGRPCMAFSDDYYHSIWYSYRAP